jgi:rhodanese-related sulfurtransferase
MRRLSAELIALDYGKASPRGDRKAEPLDVGGKKAERADVDDTQHPDELQSTEVLELLDAGWSYLDVRTVQEFERGHVPGAFNVPSQLGSVAGLYDNPDFSSCVAAVFPKPARVIVGCHSGGRSNRAKSLLRAQGHTHIVAHADGWDGRPDAFGRKQGGWLRAGLPIASHAEPGRSYAELSRQAELSHQAEVPHQTYE